MKTVAFLQNMWVRNPDRVKAVFAREGEAFRLKYIKYALFAGCLTGRRLKVVFGQEACSEIVWEETTREIAGDAKTIFPPQPGHIQAVLAQHQPDIVLAFGTIASNALYKILQRTPPGKTLPLLITAPHPAARQPDTLLNLQRAAES